jgi:hypothetical protein
VDLRKNLNIGFRVRRKRRVKGVRRDYLSNWDFTIKDLINLLKR